MSTHTCCGLIFVWQAHDYLGTHKLDGLSPRACRIEITHGIWGTPTPIPRQRPGLVLEGWCLDGLYTSAAQACLCYLIPHKGTCNLTISRYSSSLWIFHILSHLHPTLPLPIKILVYFWLHHPGSKQHSLPYIQPNMPQASTSTIMSIQWIHTTHHT